jgi:mannosyltransferase OCH1-like enzyme
MSKKILKLIFVNVFEKPFQMLNDKQASEIFKNNKIPPIVYQTWESNLFGKTHFKELNRFRSLNPDLSFCLYTKSMRQSYMEEFWGNHKIFDIYNRSIFGPMKTDIFRYCLLFDKGGFYFDINKMCETKISNMLEVNDELFLSHELNTHCFLPEFEIVKNNILYCNYFIQWGMGFMPNHPILKQIIDNICIYSCLFENNIYPNPKQAILQLTGPGMFTKSIYETLNKTKDFEIKTHGIDFEGYGNYMIKGSWVRHHKNPSYSNSKNSKILN